MNFDLHPQKLLMNLRKINYFSSLANSNFQHLKYKDHSPRNFTNPTSFLRAIQNHCLDKISKYYIYMHENTEKQKMETYKAEAFKEEKWSETKIRAKGNSKDYGLAQSAGYKQGQEVTLNHGVNGKETDKLGIRQ